MPTGSKASSLEIVSKEDSYRTVLGHAVTVVQMFGIITVLDYKLFFSKYYAAWMLHTFSAAIKNQHPNFTNQDLQVAMKSVQENLRLATEKSSRGEQAGSFKAPISRVTELFGNVDDKLTVCSHALETHDWHRQLWTCCLHSRQCPLMSKLVYCLVSP